MNRQEIKREEFLGLAVFVDFIYSLPTSIVRDSRRLRGKQSERSDLNICGELMCNRWNFHFQVFSSATAAVFVIVYFFKVWGNFFFV